MGSALSVTPDDPSNLQINRDGESLWLSWDSTPGTTYEIQGSPNLDPMAWGKIDAFSATGSTSLWSIPAPIPSEPNRFFRINLVKALELDEVQLVHSAADNSFAGLSTSTYAEARQRLELLSADGGFSIPLPVPEIRAFEALSLRNAAIHFDDSRLTATISAEAELLGKTVNLLLIMVWNAESPAEPAFALSTKVPQFDLTEWIPSLEPTALGDLSLGDSGISLASKALDLDFSTLPGDMGSVFGSNKLSLKSGLNFFRQLDLSEFAKLSDALGDLGFSDSPIGLQGPLDIDPNRLFGGTGSTPGPAFELHAQLPNLTPMGFPNWLTPLSRVLDFRMDGGLSVRIFDTFSAKSNGKTTTFSTETMLSTNGNYTSLQLIGSLVSPWQAPFGIDWLTLEEADLGLSIDSNGAGEVELYGKLRLGEEEITTRFAVRDEGGTPEVNLDISLDSLSLADVIALTSSISGASPFGGGLPDDALSVSDVQISFDSADAYSLSVTGTTTILQDIQADILFSYLQPEQGPAVLTVGLSINQFQLNALYAGVNGSLSGDLRFPGAAFIIVQELPSPPVQPLSFESTDLSLPSLSFYQKLYGSNPFTLELDVGLNFSGTFKQSAFPQLVRESLGMDPNAEILLGGSLGLKLGALTGGGLISLERLALYADLPGPSNPLRGLPGWISDVEVERRLLRFDFSDPEILISISDTLSFPIDGSRRRFQLETTLQNDGQQTQLSLDGQMLDQWASPFGVSWLDLENLQLHLVTDGSSGSGFLSSSFNIGNSEIALDFRLSASQGNLNVEIEGRVDALSLNGFIELAENQLGANISPFGDSNLDFSFTDVSMKLKLGTKRSFSIDATTHLLGKNAQMLFAAIYPSGGGSPCVITSVKMLDWSMVDLLNKPLDSMGVSADGFRNLISDWALDQSILTIAKSDESIDSSELDPEVHEYYSSVYGRPDFDLDLTSGLNLLGTLPMGGTSVEGTLSALGSPGNVVISGGLPASIFGMGGGGSGLSGLSLAASLPPLSPPGAPEWFESGQLSILLTPAPSITLRGELTVNMPTRQDEEQSGETPTVPLTFSVEAAVARDATGVVFALTGGLVAEEPWEQAFGIEWLTFRSMQLSIGVDSSASVSLGFSGDMDIGSKDIASTVVVAINASGVPTNFIFEGKSDAGFGMADLVSIQQKMALVENPSAAPLDLALLPDIAIRQVELKFAPRRFEPLDVEAGLAIGGELWIPTTPGGSAQYFSSAFLSIDKQGILADGDMGQVVFGPITIDDAKLDLALTLIDQHFIVRGSTDLGELMSGEIDLSLTRDMLSFSSSSKVFNQFNSTLTAEGAFNLQNPAFTVTGLMENDFKNALGPMLKEKVLSKANASASFAKTLLGSSNALGSNFTGFVNSSNPGSLIGRVPGFLNAAGIPTNSTIYQVVNALATTTTRIRTLVGGVPSGLLGKALGGTTITIPRLFFPDLVYHIPGVADIFPGVPRSEQGFINNYLVPALIAKFETILSKSNTTLLIIKKAEFTADLEDAIRGQGIDMSIDIEFLGFDYQIVAGDWDFSNISNNLDTLTNTLTSLL